MKTTTHIETITPEIASVYLSLNTKNRPTSKSHIKFLSDQMKSGQWKMTGEPIIFSDDRLLDGQNRLKAIIESGVTIQALVVRGIDNSAFTSMGVSKTRGASDVLAIAGFANTNRLAAACRLVDNYFSGRTFRGKRHTNEEVLLIAQKYTKNSHLIPCIVESVKNAYRLRTKASIAPDAVVASTHYIFSCLSIPEANLFMEKIHTGIGLNEDDPERILRERLIKNSIVKANLSDAYIFSLFIKCWNIRRKGQTIKQLRVREEGNAEAAPIAI
jgi:hypothetical protein